MPVYVIGDWRKPITPIENELLALPGHDAAGRKYRRKIGLRKHLFGVDTGHKPESMIEELMQALLPKEETK